MNEKRQEARNATMNLEFVTAEEAIHTLVDMFGAAEVARIAHEHELAIFHANTFMGCPADKDVKTDKPERDGSDAHTLLGSGEPE